MKWDKLQSLIKDESTCNAVKTTLVEVVDELHVAVGAMILDGYDEFDSSVKYVNEVINEIKLNIQNLRPDGQEVRKCDD